MESLSFQGRTMNSEGKYNHRLHETIPHTLFVFLFVLASPSVDRPAICTQTLWKHEHDTLAIRVSSGILSASLFLSVCLPAIPFSTLVHDERTCAHAYTEIGLDATLSLVQRKRQSKDEYTSLDYSWKRLGQLSLSLD